MLNVKKSFLCAICLFVFLFAPSASAKAINPVDYDLRDYAPSTVKMKTFDVGKNWSKDGTRIFEYSRTNPGRLGVNKTVAYVQVPIVYDPNGGKIESTNGSYLYYDSAYILELPMFMRYLDGSMPTTDKFISMGSTGKMDFNGTSSVIDDIDVDVYKKMGWVKKCIKIKIQKGTKTYFIYLAKGIGLVYMEGNSADDIINLKNIAYKK